MKKIAIICDFSEKSGFGHIVRMRSLSRSFVAMSYEVVFLFEQKNKKFIKKYVKDLKCKYLPFNLKKDSKKIKNYLYQQLFNIIIFDSYLVSIELERRLYKNFFLVSIDDKVLNHNSHLVINSKEELSQIRLSKPGQIWITGRNCILMNKTQNQKKNRSIPKKVLIHAGGSNAYNLIDNFFNETIRFLSQKKIKVDILCGDKKNYNTILKKIKIITNNFSKFQFIKFNKKFSKSLSKYDIVAGPAGTTTFEAISSGSVPFSFPLLNDGRDSMMTWNLLGNIMHLDFKEKDKKIIISQAWEFIFSKYKILNSTIQKNSSLISNNSNRICRLIIKYYNNKSLLLSRLKNKNNIFKVKKAEIKYARLFLNSRNSSRVREVSSNPNHIISWAEHLNWWTNKNIKKFILIKNKIIPSAYHWIKTVNYNKKNIIISGWFLDKNEKDTLRASYEILKHQRDFLKKNYKGFHWLININKKNNLSIRMNKSLGFKKASLISTNNAIDIFKFDKKVFNVYEMKL